MADYPELLRRRLDEILSSSQDEMLRSAIARIYLRHLLELTTPQEWERPEEAVWVRGREQIVLHCFRLGICCAVAAQHSGPDRQSFRWGELISMSETLITKFEQTDLTEERHVWVSETSQIVANYFAGNTSAREALRLLFPNAGSRSDWRSSAVEDLSSIDFKDSVAEDVFDLQNDIRFHSPEDALRQELFSPENESEFTSKPHYVTIYFEHGLSSAGEVWTFWSDWYNGFLEGKPLDWKLQERVALIDDAIWSAGPDAVAEEIAKIKVEMALENFRGIHAGNRTTRHGVGGNYPPEAIEDPKDLVSSMDLVWKAIGDIEDEVAKPTPDRGSLEIALGALKSGLTALLRWSGHKADLALDTAIKWSILVVGGTYLAAHPDKVQALIEAVEGWLKFIP
ncbi:hypothetical protein [Ruegeria sp. EL01]|jgi:hypothetical protein|uniref:hypothetical protein n=1 Tax=Ruegeria sp. EL01 TaxID=2107578 RepID=UPI000EA80230|nr:hypothetical protein [Ruegeria sp. EL01]